jgi:hypothetical protein
LVDLHAQGRQCHRSILLRRRLRDELLNIFPVLIIRYSCAYITCAEHVVGGNLGHLCRVMENFVRSLYGWKGDELAIPGGPLNASFGLPLVHLRLSSAVPGCMPAMMPRVIYRHTPSLAVHSTWISFNVASFFFLFHCCLRVYCFQL